MYRKRFEEYEARDKSEVLRRRKRDSFVDSYGNHGDSESYISKTLKEFRIRNIESKLEKLCFASS